MTAIASSPAVVAGSPHAGDRSAVAHADRAASIDVLRGLAALGVLAFHSQFLSFASGHATYYFGSNALLGESSVALFFAISGYLIGGPFIRALMRGEPLPATMAYGLRRAARILPAYWIALAASILIDHHAGLPGARTAGIFALLLQNLVPWPGQSLPYLIVSWTLCVELAFYVLVPLVAWLVRRRSLGPVRPGALLAGIALAWIASAVCAEVAYRLLPIGGSSPWTAVGRLSLPVMLCLFCPGLLLAVATGAPAGSLPAAERLLRSRRRLVLLGTPLLAGLLGLATLRTVEHATPVGPLSFQLLALAAGVLLSWAITHRGALPMWLRPLSLAGVVSYGLYLWHMTVISALDHLGVIPNLASFKVREAAFAVLVACATLPLAVLSWHLVEKPLMAAAARAACGGAMERRRGAVAVGLAAVLALAAVAMAGTAHDTLSAASGTGAGAEHASTPGGTGN